MKGQKTGGRAKGTPNKTTSAVRDWLISLINNSRSQIEKDLKSLEPKDRLLMIEKLLPYVMPKCINPDEVEGACFTRSNIKSCGGFGNSGEVETWVDVEGSRKYKIEKEQIRYELDLEKSKQAGFCFSDCNECKVCDICEKRKQQNKLTAENDCWAGFEGCEGCDFIDTCKFYKEYGDFGKATEEN